MHLIVCASRCGLGVFLFAACFAEAPPVDAPSTSSGASGTGDASSGGTSSTSQTSADTTESSTSTPSTAESTGTSTTGGMQCSVDGIELGEGWSQWTLVRIGMPGLPPPPCPDEAQPIAVLLATTEPVQCGCDCGSHAELCDIHLLSSTSGCGVSVVDSALPPGECRTGFAEGPPALYQDITSAALAGNCDGPSVPVAESIPPWTVCELPGAFECDANQRVCTIIGETASPCPEGTEPLPAAQHVDCAPCGCPMSEWCNAARVDLFSDTMCDVPAAPPAVFAGRGCQQQGEFRSAHVGEDSRLGCMVPPQQTSPQTVCCVP